MRLDWNTLNYLRNYREYEGAMHRRTVVEINRWLISTIQARQACFGLAHHRRVDEAMFLDPVPQRLPTDSQLSGGLGDIPFGQS